ncbi:hypothetical protein [Mycoplasmopsis cynos]|uniref:hypothetical protein n=1 Tax=Mycoplasmopsis cynos TaxID=171284 RepID=UPI0021FC51BE|nr:hypothetical protein [Mycoplasmopsis cynos]UWV81542.1 hypothetical protein NW065_06590 [Mycoplasmopsis cynos]
MILIQRNAELEDLKLKNTNSVERDGIDFKNVDHSAMKKFLIDLFGKITNIKGTGNASAQELYFKEGNELQNRIRNNTETIEQYKNLLKKK